MEKLSLSIVRQQHNGAINLPPGFRFHPTDEELVVQYLRRKVFSCPLPASIIPEINLGKCDPWDLPGRCEQERYFFALREVKYANSNRSNRATGCGYWKATSKDRAIVSSKYNKVVGVKKTLVFYRGKGPSGSKTDWIMHEYRLTSFPQRKNSTHISISIVVPTRDWVLCRIFMKKRAIKMNVGNGEHLEEEERAIEFIDFMGRRNEDRRPSSPSDSDSSCVTEPRDESSN
ncbi:NAC domain-containing protein 83-like [Asparagus officinalis]|uniref:NAC domain-containing protein 83-like n=1 Tax=Asparagus officinalis TaxID=4686 RepID=UPI00098E27CC|nr:NAC domain-containing protein 83-like [Asparagus officinalis]